MKHDFNFPIYVKISSYSDHASYSKILSPYKEKRVLICGNSLVSVDIINNEKDFLKDKCMSFKKVEENKFLKFVTKHEYETFLNKAIEQLSK